ncbi:amino acid ABC transporter permease [Actinophytocola algeriensis]|uniref:Polar amino acid transport system permease protein n=1 Tax=Actinophytocola algeriensis TaxID=1768010 RepID=A0A7W7VDZ1_9PSEU|nr:amino acid ABC transporter permease [Actinophytocola algeriensis]MBB4906599.1 polar amino acid transport system permease protein [Actinophytocola algeriensis]MBE1478080.1 polar amino acid transport system permease protein [Actinophytocola algeriensis]
MTSPETDERKNRIPPEQIVAVPVRHPGRWVAAAALLVLAAMLVNSLVTNPAWSWDVVWQFLFSDRVLKGLWVTIELTLLAMVIGVVLGIVVAVMRLSRNPIVSTIAWLYAWFFRGTPVLVQVIFWSYIAVLYPTLSLGIPFGPEFVYFDSNLLIPIFAGAVLGFGLNEAAYMSEIVRAGILSVDQGQTEAAEALGMTRLKILRRIVLPQAMRVIIPPTGNETISMLKTTSLASVIAVGDLFTQVQLIYGGNLKYVPLLVVASIWYLVLTSLLSIAQYFIERRYSRGAIPARQGGFLGFGRPKSGLA